MKIVYSAVLGAAALMSAGLAMADNIGAYGAVAQVAVVGSQADEYSSARGRLVIDEGQQFYRNYQWGGTACNGKNMSEADVANLIMALKDRRELTVTPIWKVGAGGARCLVAYRITAIEVVQ